MTSAILSLPLLIAEKMDAFAWKHFRNYRRKEMRNRMRVTIKFYPMRRCEFCKAEIEVIKLRNGARICMSCQEGR